MQRAYVSAASSHWGAPWLSQVGLGVSLPIPNTETKLIVGGNHKIRILDHREGLAYAVLKEGFDPVFMQRELETRRLVEQYGVLVPPLEEVGKDGYWFSERYVSGTPTNRLADASVAQQALEDATQSLHLLLNATMREESVSEYAGQLAERARWHILANHLLSKNQKESLKQTVEDLIGRIDALLPATENHIVTAVTHGDFQPANILVNEDRVWLIDWEYSSRRQAGYDAFVYGLRSRFPKGLSKRIQKLEQEELESEFLLVVDNWPGLERHNDSTRWRLRLVLFFQG